MNSLEGLTGDCLFFCNRNYQNYGVGRSPVFKAFRRAENVPLRANPTPLSSSFPLSPPPLSPSVFSWAGARRWGRWERGDVFLVAASWFPLASHLPMRAALQMSPKVHPSHGYSLWLFRGLSPDPPPCPVPEVSDLLGLLFSFSPPPRACPQPLSSATLEVARWLLQDGSSLAWWLLQPLSCKKQALGSKFTSFLPTF